MNERTMKRGLWMLAAVLLLSSSSIWTSCSNEEKNVFVNVNSPWMLWATKTGCTDYNITMTGNLGAPDVQQRSGDADYFKPTYSYRAYDVLKVQEVVSNREFGAGATL